eukprot:2357636-Alexandrium_andersonii.AAC.1
MRCCPSALVLVAPPEICNDLADAPCRKCKIASGVRSLSCAGPDKPSKSVPEVLEGCVLRCCARRF